jgi:hypothetical protein
MALVAAVTECTGAVLLGARARLTVLGTAMLTGVMTNVTAIHLRNGLDSRKHGFEFELMILAGVVAIGLCGPATMERGPLARRAGPGLARTGRRRARRAVRPRHRLHPARAPGRCGGAARLGRKGGPVMPSLRPPPITQLAIM